MGSISGTQAGALLSLLGPTRTAGGPESAAEEARESPAQEAAEHASQAGGKRQGAGVLIDVMA